MAELFIRIVNLAKATGRPGGRTFGLLLILIFASHQLAFGDHVHHLWYNNSIWQDQDLTALTAGPGAPAGSAVTAFRTTPNNQLHVYYIDPNNHVHQLYFNGKSWSDGDLTAVTGAPAATPSTISGFAIGNLQYVFYTSDPDFHVHELYYNNSIWQDQDLTALTGGGTTAGPVLGFPTVPNNQFHVFYQEISTLDLHELYFNGTSWTDADLSTIMGGITCGASWWSGFAINNLQHIFCQGPGTPNQNIDVFHIYYNNVTWVYEDVTSAAGTQSAGVGAAVAAFSLPCSNQLEVYTIAGTNLHFEHAFHTDGMWIGDDLTNRIGAPGDASSGQIVAFLTAGNNQYHIYYAPGSDVYQVYFNGTSWSVQDLTSGHGNADSSAGMAGFAVGNQQHVFYMSNN